MENVINKEVNEKEIKKTVKKKEENKLQERIDKLNKIGKFNLLPEIEIEKKDFKLLKEVLKNKKKIDFLKLCRILDMKPSKLNEMLTDLSKNKLVTYQDDNIELTDLGERFAIKESYGNKKDKKFKSFISVLTDEDFEEFCSLCKNVKSDIKEIPDFPNVILPL